MLSFEMTSNNRLKLIPPELNGGEHRLEILFNGIPFPGAPKLAIVQDIEVFNYSGLCLYYYNCSKLVLISYF